MFQRYQRPTGPTSQNCQRDQRSGCGVAEAGGAAFQIIQCDRQTWPTRLNSQPDSRSEHKEGLIKWLANFQLNDRCNKIVRTQNLTTLPNGKKYFFSYPTHLYEANWTQANEICTRQMGMNLATIKDQADFDAIWNEAKTIQNNGWWLSARKYTKGDGHTDFYWHDQTLLAESNHGAWRLIQPGGECVYIYTPAGVKKFSATVCNTVWYFVCELPADCY
ncbi:uncharacterized protein LOC132193417 isoform X2 [Neocloeon triangulifer]|uniref:uncharacterized protein LOC132193417 isoform X2 n=1 Tax=Neocloeon triangulifer TaxID=2078957 RepID=UPI00286F64B4|nr:uncharacterized protein LOC132193417 isoform X2 [Neocloeon triangulifer]